MMAPTLARKVLLRYAAALYEDGRHFVATDLFHRLAIDSEDYLRERRPAEIKPPAITMRPKTVEKLTSMSTEAR